MKIYKRLFYIIFYAMFSCNSDKDITKLLSSDVKDDIILGAIKAGESEDKKFVPLLLKNAADWRRSTSFDFKGMTVYRAKMEALRKIYKMEPPVEIKTDPDSTVIKFYTALYEKEYGK